MSKKESCPHWCEKNRRYQTNWTLHQWMMVEQMGLWSWKSINLFTTPGCKGHTSGSCQPLAGWGDLHMFTKWRYVGTSLGISRVCFTCICRGKNPKTNFTFKKGCRQFTTKKPLVLSFSLQIFTHALGRVISPGKKSWHTLLRISCSPVRGSRCTQEGPSFFIWGPKWMRWGEVRGGQEVWGSTFWILMFPICSQCVPYRFHWHS